MIEAVLELPFKLALMTAVWLLLTRAAVAVKLAELDPPATLTDDGTVKLALLLLSATLDPPLGAAPLKLTVQLVLPGVVRAEAWQAIELIVTPEPMVIWPPDALVATGAPVGDAAAVLVTPTLIGPELEGVRLIVATTPLPMPILLRPLATHVDVPEPWVHCKVLLADVRATPAVTEKPDPDDAG